MEEALATLKLLQDTRKVVEQDWCQHALRDGNRSCLIGALFSAGALSEFKGVSTRVFALVRNETVVPIDRWNDAKERTQQDVLDLIDRIIVRLS